VEVCPTGANIFGERDSLIAEAESRIRNNPGKYVNHIYGKEEVGGTSVLYISHIPFEKLGLPTLDTEPLPPLTWKALSAVPSVIVGTAAIASAIYWITKRRMDVEKGGSSDRESKEE
jgi:formate dehydrogenase iron-sulfur subunit